jgi:amino acid permease
MSGRARIAPLLVGAVGILILGIGIVYLTVACENLPGILGPHPGDTSPRTPLGVVGVVLGLVVLSIAWMRTRRRPPQPPLHS